MKYYIWILGCQYNEWDGARIKYALSNLGLEESESKDADVVIILSCSVRQTAIDRILGRVKNWKKKNIFLTGCVLDQDRKVFENKGITIIEQGNVEELTKAIKNLSRGIATPPTRRMARNDNLTNLVPIMVGCNNFCAYCAVPYTRGREKSRDFDEIIKDVKSLVSAGKKEIMLLGQNVNSYKSVGEEVRGRENKTDFTVLLETLNDLPGDFIISFTSNHPKDMSDDIINAVATLPKIKKEIHLPVQSGSDNVLKSMNRPYTIEKYESIIKKIHKANPEIRITTDVIVGFPGETEKDFEKTVQLFKKIKFHQAYINKYSPRKGTKAYELSDPVSLEEKHRRWNVLNDIAYHKKY